MSNKLPLTSGPVVQPGILSPVMWASGRGTSGLQANYHSIEWPDDRKAAGSNPARSTKINSQYGWLGLSQVPCEWRQAIQPQRRVIFEATQPEEVPSSLLEQFV